MYSDNGPPIDPARPADDARLTAEVRAVAASAQRRAVRDGDSQADTAHLLHSLLQNDQDARAACRHPARARRPAHVLTGRGDVRDIGGDGADAG